jgi:hypothetical protein
MRLRAMLLSCTLLFAMASFAHNGNDHVMGTVTVMSANSITVQPVGKDTKPATVAVVSSTMFMKSAAQASLKDLKVGDRVVIEAKEKKDDTLEAVSVTFGKPAAHDLGNMDMKDMKH